MRGEQDGSGGGGGKCVRGSLRISVNNLSEWGRTRYRRITCEKKTPAHEDLSPLNLG